MKLIAKECSPLYNRRQVWFCDEAKWIARKDNPNAPIAVYAKEKQVGSDKKVIAKVCWLLEGEE